jgi:hypothetical protein
MIQRERVKDWKGKVIGFIETDTLTGNKIIRDFYGKIKGRYNKKLNITQDFYGRIVAKGDQSSMMLTYNRGLK